MKKANQIGLYIFLLMLFYSMANAECLIIVNQSVEESSLTKQNIKRIFLGKKKKWSNGGGIYPVKLKAGKLHKKFIKKYVEKSIANYNNYWRLAITVGTGLPPVTATTEKKIVDYVSKKKGAIGYISSDSPHEIVKVIIIK